MLASARDRGSVSPVAAALGCVVMLVLASVGLALVANRLDWTLYTLVRDLRWAGFLLWAGLLLWAALASASDAVRRSGLPLGHLFGRSTWPRAAQRVWAGVLVLAAAAVLLPAVWRPSPRGVSLLVGEAWRAAAAAVPASLAPRFEFHGASPARPERPLSVVIAGWMYAPVSGQYHFSLAAHGDALVEIDGRPLLGLGAHGATLDTAWATDPSGARRAATGLGTGFHRIRLLYRQPADPAHLAFGWIPPYLTQARQIPARYLLPDGTAPETRRWRALALTGQRLGIVVLVSLLVVRLTGIAVRRIAGAAPLRPAR